MKRRTFVVGAVAAGTSLAAAKAGYAQEAATPNAAGEAMTQTDADSGYVPINGLQMYYELRGAGEPLMLLHGAFGGTNLWGPLLDLLAAQHQVIAVDFQAHGRTADIDRPFSYEAFADDVAGMMEHLGIVQADVVGYSMGANTALRLAIQHPDRVRKLVAISANYRHDGYYPEVWDVVAAMKPEFLVGLPFETSYVEVAPNPEDFPKLVERIKAFNAIDFAWPDEEIAAISAPTMLISGDSDNMRPEHTVALFRLLGGGVPGDLTGLPRSQLAIIPARTHITTGIENPELLDALIEPFLAAPMPEGA